MTVIDPKSCEVCGYAPDCDGYWRFCPYNGSPTSQGQDDTYRQIGEKDE